MLAVASKFVPRFCVDKGIAIVESVRAVHTCKMRSKQPLKSNMTIRMLSPPTGAIDKWQTPEVEICISL